MGAWGQGGHPGTAHSSDNSKQLLPLEGLPGAPPSVSRAGRSQSLKSSFPHPFQQGTISSVETVPWNSVWMLLLSQGIYASNKAARFPV